MRRTSPNKLGPNLLPVVRTKVLPAHHSACSALDANAILRIGLSLTVAVLPLPHLRIALRTYGRPQFRDGESAALLEIGVQ